MSKIGWMATGSTWFEPSAFLFVDDMYLSYTTCYTKPGMTLASIACFIAGFALIPKGPSIGSRYNIVHTSEIHDITTSVDLKLKVRYVRESPPNSCISCRYFHEFCCQDQRIYGDLGWARCLLQMSSLEH